MTAAARIATESDAAEVGALLDRFNAEYDEFTPGAGVLAERVREHLAGDVSAFLLAGPPDTGVAQLRFREYLFSGRPVALLEELYVVGDRRREGHGRKLVEAAFEVARDRGAESIELGTSVDDRAARALYEALGFTNLEREGRPKTQMLYYEREL